MLYYGYMRYDLCVTSLGRGRIGPIIYQSDRRMRAQVDVG
jgi:hypothetical protein